MLNEADRVAALPGGVVVPLTAPDGDAVPPLQSVLPPRSDQLLSPPPQELLQVNGIGPLLLLVGKVDIGSREKSPLHAKGRRVQLHTASFTRSD